MPEEASAKGVVIVARGSGPTETRAELLDERLRQRTKAGIRKTVDSLQSEVKVGLSRRARGFIAIEQVLRLALPQGKQRPAPRIEAEPGEGKLAFERHRHAAFELFTCREIWRVAPGLKRHRVAGIAQPNLPKRFSIAGLPAHDLLDLRVDSSAERSCPRFGANL